MATRKSPPVKQISLSSTKSIAAKQTNLSVAKPLKGSLTSAAAKEEEETEEETDLASFVKDVPQEDGSKNPFRRLIAYSVLRKQKELKGVRWGTEEFAKITHQLVEKWLNEYEPTTTGMALSEVDSEVLDAVYAYYELIGLNVPVSRKVLLAKVMRVLPPEWDEMAVQLEGQLNTILSHPDFSTIKGPQGGTALMRERTQYLG